jgi:hypothetical protein
MLLDTTSSERKDIFITSSCLYDLPCIDTERQTYQYALVIFEQPY